MSEVREQEEMIKVCCDAMRNAVIEGAIDHYNGVPEVVGRGTESTNVHFPLKFCPFCGVYMLSGRNYLTGSINTPRRVDMHDQREKK